MIREATGRKRRRVIKSVGRREVDDTALQFTDEIPPKVGTRMASLKAASVETLAHTGRRVARELSDPAIDCRLVRTLSEDDKFAIYQQYSRGAEIESLAHRYGRAKTSVRRVLGEMRAKRILKLPLDFIPNPEFDRADADAIILTELPGSDTSLKTTKVPSGLPPYLASLYEIPLLTREQELHLFRKFNYLKYKAAKLRSQLDPAHAKHRLMDQLEMLYEAAIAVKNQILQANLRLVVSIAKRYVGSGGDLWELISDGNVSLIRAIEKFDFARGNKISTYASWAIMRNFARTIPSELRHQERFRTSHAEMLGASEERRSDYIQLESEQRQREAQTQRILAKLDEREQQIVMYRFGLLKGQEPQTLEQIGAGMGVSKERVRQLQQRALNKLRVFAAEANIELPDIK